ncbi:GmrSD restriction endonuclease domain-containing protein [Halomonas maura]|uniref:GmrSD restriction endonuclease domain-containing protein n=1 Tax=Halomonas maura TaxID=117606 RepID=UPI0025B3C8C8|nr:DUF262 domain-containing protein [Halomonas maura]MDN3554690.1 DUF262 domain-containing protein [Halomonas maura]
MKISTLLDQIDNGQTALPEFQRGYVWNRDQVRGLMTSLYKRYPVGSLLSWATDASNVGHRGDHQLNAGTVNLLLDGQQRITSLYGIVRGKPPAFFDGDERAFTDLYFNVESEEFSFYMPSRMANDPKWISVTRLMDEGSEGMTKHLLSSGEISIDDLSAILNRLNRLRDVRDIEVHVEQISGEDKTLDVVVDIFNKVNSGGTKLSKGDLALARICSTQPDARARMRQALEDWKAQGFHFSLDWLLRCITTLTTNEARFVFIHDLDGQQFVTGLNKAIKHISYLLDVIGDRLGLDHQQVLTGHYAFPVLVRHIEEQGGKITDKASLDAMLYWYIHSAIWGRYSGSTESVLSRDLDILLDNQPDGIQALIQELHLWRGSLKVRADHFSGHTRGNRFYSLLYMLTRVGEAKDWGLGITLKKNMLGSNSSLELHHIFPKHRLREYGYDRKQINSLANFCFLTKGSNLSISNRLPMEYFAVVRENHPEALQSQWVPMDEALWQIDRYPDFLKARRELLAQATNALLDELYPFDDSYETAYTPAPSRDIPGGIESEEEELQLRDLQQWMEEQKLPSGELEHELVDAHTGAPRAILDLAWPDGFQPGLDGPAVLLLNEESEVVMAASKAGYQVFEEIDKLKRHVAEHILDAPYAALPEWAQHLSKDAIPIAEWVMDNELPEPVVGHDVQDGSQTVVGAFELAWPERKVGIWSDQGRANPIPETLVGWHLYSLEEVREAPTLLTHRLKEASIT